MSHENPRGSDSERSYFHIHVDGTELSQQTQCFLRDLGLWEDNFDDSYNNPIAPILHWTWKGLQTQATEMRRKMSSIRGFLTACGFSAEEVSQGELPHVYAGDPSIFRGYVEVEAIPDDIDVEEKPFKEGVSIPFVLEMRPIESAFRQSEVHVVMDEDGSDPRLHRALLAMGMYEARKPLKTGGMRMIYTAQAETRQTIDGLLPDLLQYLVETGGGRGLSVKREHIVDFVATPNISVPPVISRITKAS